MKMRKTFKDIGAQPRKCLQLFYGPAILGFLLTVAGCQLVGLKDQVCFKDRCFEVEVAADVKTWTQGLQGRTELGENQGMLFVFPESKPYPFWMKDTLIPLDMIWLDFSKRIVSLEKSVPPCQKDPCPNYVPPAPALYVLELKAGTVERLGLKKGDRLSFRLEKYFAENFK